MGIGNFSRADNNQTIDILHLMYNLSQLCEHFCCWKNKSGKESKQHEKMLWIYDRYDDIHLFGHLLFFLSYLCNWYQTTLLSYDSCHIAWQTNSCWYSWELFIFQAPAGSTWMERISQIYVGYIYVYLCIYIILGTEQKLWFLGDQGMKENVFFPLLAWPTIICLTSIQLCDL